MHIRRFERAGGNRTRGPKEMKMLTPKRQSQIAFTMTLLFALSTTALALPWSGAAQLSFRLRAADGGEISSEMLRGDIVVLAFGASWLPLSKTQMEGLQELADEYAGRNLRVYWVSTDSDKQGSKNYATDEQLRSMARKNGLKVAVLRDPDGAFFKKTGADQIPSLIILDREGRVSGGPVGGISTSTDPKDKLVNVLSGRLNSLLGGQ